MTTLESLQALSDAELVKRVKLEVMRWTDSGERLVPNGKMKGKLREMSLVHVWWTPDSGGEYGIAPYFWDPLTDWNHTMDVVTELQKHKNAGVILRLWERTADGTLENVEVWPKASKTPILLQAGKSIQRAILLAALLAVSK